MLFENEQNVKCNCEYCDKSVYHYVIFYYCTFKKEELVRRGKNGGFVKCLCCSKNKNVIKLNDEVKAEIK